MNLSKLPSLFKDDLLQSARSALENIETVDGFSSKELQSAKKNLYAMEDRFSSLNDHLSDL